MRRWLGGHHAHMRSVDFPAPIGPGTMYPWSSGAEDWQLETPPRPPLSPFFPLSAASVPCGSGRTAEKRKKRRTAFEGPACSGQSSLRWDKPSGGGRAFSTVVLAAAVAILVSCAEVTALDNIPGRNTMTKRNLVQAISEELDRPQLETDSTYKTLDAIIRVLVDQAAWSCAISASSKSGGGRPGTHQPADRWGGHGARTLYRDIQGRTADPGTPGSGMPQQDSGSERAAGWHTAPPSWPRIKLG